jgi:hypothetical protein
MTDWAGTVERVNLSMWPDWRIRCANCPDTPTVCDDEGQARAWAKNHHAVVMTTTVAVSWPGSFLNPPSWLYDAIAPCVVRGCLRIGHVLGVETGNGMSGWATGLYTRTEQWTLTEDTLNGLGSAIETELANSPFDLGTGAIAAPMSAHDYQVATMMTSAYERRWVGWRT